MCLLGFHFAGDVVVVAVAAVVLVVVVVEAAIKQKAVIR